MDYYAVSVRDVSDLDLVGCSWHEAPDGKDRFFLSLEGVTINTDLDPEWQAINWSALSLPCAEALCETLLTMFEIKEIELGSWRFRRKRSSVLGRLWRWIRRVVG